MPQAYVIRSGDCLMSIAEKHGMDWRRIWDDGGNAELRKRRGNPNILHPGDVLQIPAVDDGPESVELEKVHSFRLPRKCAVRIALYDSEHNPKTDVPYHFTVDGVDLPEARTGADGVAEAKVERTAQDIELTVPWGVFPVLLGHLDPANTVRGAQQRLNSLGFNAGAPDGKMGPRTRGALAEFQQVEKLEVNGWLDQPTIRRLRRLHDGETLAGAPEELDNMPPPEVLVDLPPRTNAELSYDDLVFEEEPGWG